jgi:hypothetical protein
MGVRRARRGLLAAASLCFAFGGMARAADFYQGKQLSFVINYAVGGPADTEGRIIARHLGRHIPGEPTVIVRNMAGAGGIVGANWLGQVAAPDGLTLGFLTGVASKAAMADPGLKVDASKFAFVAGGNGISVTFIRTDVPPGMKRPEDVLKARDFWVGGLTPDTDKDVRERLQLDMLAIPYKYVSGYGNTADARLAFTRNEIQMYNESLPTYRSAVEPGLVKTGEAIPLWFDPFDDGEKLSRSPDTASIDALTYPDFLKKAKGALPTGDMWESYRLLNAVGTTFLRIFAMLPGTPKAAVEAVQAGLSAMSKDPEFRKDAVTSMKFVPTYIIGAKTEALFRTRLSPDRRLVAWLRAYIEKGKMSNGKK